LLTIAGNYWRRKLDDRRFPVATKFYQTEPGVQVLVHSQTPASEPLAQLILVHGLEGSSSAGYARSLAQAALEAGCATHRFNMRSCGGTEHLSGLTLYHSGQTSDLLAVVHQISRQQLPRSAPILLVGFSLGGNVVLKLAGELGASASHRGSQLIAGVMAVSTPIDLAACVRTIDKPANILYARRFLTRLCDRVRCKSLITPHLYSTAGLDSVKSIWEFDDRFTAPLFGFGTAANYYATQSAQNFLSSIRIPTLIIAAQDDPLVPFEIYRHPAFAQNPALTLLAPANGGHLGFLSRHKPRFWLDQVALNWLLAQSVESHPLKCDTLSPVSHPVDGVA